MSRTCPTAAAACFLDNSEGRFPHPSSPTPAAIAPDVTSAISMPDFCTAANSRTKRAIRRRSKWPPSRVRRLVPILTTRRLGTIRLGLHLGFIRKFDAADADRIAGGGALFGELLF